MSDELSYATSHDHPIKRAFMRGIENLSGRQKLLPLYHRWQRDYVDKSARMWADALDLIKTKLEITAPEGWRSIAPDVPMVIIANHPFGIADGIAIMAIAEQLGRPYRVLVNSDLLRIPEMRAKALPIDFGATREAMQVNLKTRADARRLLKAGTSIIIFPSGGVATAEKPFGRAEDLPWKLFAARLIEQSDAQVLPVYFEGQNSALFHFVSRYSLTLRLSLLVCEFRFRIGTAIKAHIGKPVTCAELKRLAGAADVTLLDELYLLVHRLAPGAAELPRAQLQARPAEVRRRFAWDAPVPTPADKAKREAATASTGE
jgi:putative hemolysin